MTTATRMTSVESVVAKETVSSSAHKALTSPWASIAAILIARPLDGPDHRPVHHVVPPRGATSRRAAGGPIFTNPSFTLDNYDEVLQRHRHRPRRRTS